MNITVALIGGDGSGKSSICERLTIECQLPFKRIYMGANIESSNYTLPWSRWILKQKLSAIRREAKALDIEDPNYLNTHHISHRQKRSGAARTLLRSIHKLTEYVYRLIVARQLQREGNNIIFDRHFLFDVAVSPDNRDGSLETQIKRANHWLLSKLLPRPDLMIFLDASPEVMVTRKKEVPVEYLRKQRQMWLQLGQTLQNFVIIDADPPIDKVFSDVCDVIYQFHQRSLEQGR